MRLFQWFNHVSWDEYAKCMPRGAELYNWVEENEMAVLNDGKPTRAAQFQQGCDLSAPDITIFNSEAADRFSWQPLNELSSDHSPILIKWNQLVKTERAQRRVRPNFHKADWNLLRARLAVYQPILEAVTDPATKQKTFVDCVQKAAAIAEPSKSLQKERNPMDECRAKDSYARTQPTPTRYGGEQRRVGRQDKRSARENPRS